LSKRDQKKVQIDEEARNRVKNSKVHNVRVTRTRFRAERVYQVGTVFKSDYDWTILNLTKYCQKYPASFIYREDKFELTVANGSKLLDMRNNTLTTLDDSPAFKWEPTRADYEAGRSLLHLEQLRKENDKYWIPPVKHPSKTKRLISEVTIEDETYLKKKNCQRDEVVHGEEQQTECCAGSINQHEKDHTEFTDDLVN